MNDIQQRAAAKHFAEYHNDRPLAAQAAQPACYLTIYHDSDSDHRRYDRQQEIGLTENKASQGLAWLAI